MKTGMRAFIGWLNIVGYGFFLASGDYLSSAVCLLLGTFVLVTLPPSKHGGTNDR